MPELTILWAIFNKFGILGVIVGYIVIYHFLWPEYKKRTGKWVSYQNMNERIMDLERRFAELNMKVDNNHENINSLLSAEVQHSYQRQKDIEKNLEEKIKRESEQNFNQHSDIFKQLLELTKK